MASTEKTPVATQLECRHCKTGQRQVVSCAKRYSGATQQRSIAEPAGEVVMNERAPWVLVRGHIRGVSVDTMEERLRRTSGKRVAATQMATFSIPSAIRSLLNQPFLKGLGHHGMREHGEQQKWGGDEHFSRGRSRLHLSKS